ncbi:hypothetical protein Tco_0290288, partial [Tanacetum coccineum]
DDIGSSEFIVYEMMKGCSILLVRYCVDTDEFITPLLEGWSIQSIVWRIVDESIFSLCYRFRKSFSSTTIGDTNPIRTLGDYSRPGHEGYRNTIELPEGNNVVPL